MVHSLPHFSGQQSASGRERSRHDPLALTLGVSRQDGTAKNTCQRKNGKCIHPQSKHIYYTERKFNMRHDTWVSTVNIYRDINVYFM